MGGVEGNIQEEVSDYQNKWMSLPKDVYIRMGQEEDVEAYYEWLTKLNSDLAPPQAQDSFLKEIFRFRLWKRQRIFIVSMLRHTLEEVVESTRQVEYDMMSWKSRTRK